ncbi:MAG: glycoside hydrolase family 3 protein [Candidatus Dormibacteraeota bacterium]|nr:glycoside hydrolase family 3 protein [Candidatus Dormibacteraeota bacterium]
MTATETTDEALDELVASLDLETAVRLLTGATNFELWAEESIGLRSIRFSDGPTGVRGSEYTGGRIVALLPNATLIAAAWDEQSAARVGALLAEEAIAQGVHVVLGPTVNLHRSPLGGRLFEAYSEDPLLSGRVAAACVRGMQSLQVGGCLKHFVGNEAETERRTVNSVIGERALREVYLLPFQITVEDTNPWTVMSAYNDVNGVAATEHAALNEGVLKGEWGWDGLLMSDWFATRRTVEPANGGIDLVMPGPEGPWGDRLVEAVRRGQVAEETVREHVRRLLRLADRVGALGSAARAGSIAPAPESPARTDELRALAVRGMTVLKNQDRVLPLRADGFDGGAPLVVAGRHALRTMGQGGGSAHVRPPHVVSVAQALTAHLGAESVTVVDGVDVYERPPIADTAGVRDPETGRHGIRITSFHEGGEEQASTFSEEAQIVVGIGGGPHDGAATLELSADLELRVATQMEIGVRGVGEFELEADGRRYPFRVEPTDPHGEADMMQPPAWTTVAELPPGTRVTARVRPDPGRVLGLGLVARPAPLPVADVLEAARRSAENVPVAVVVVGLTDEQESESKDKTTLALPGRQDDLVRAVAHAARRTVVVVNAATPVLMPWLEEVDAVLWAGLPGQEAGAAIVDALFGAGEPAGRLVTTFPRHDGQGPAWSTTPAAGVLSYEEGVAVGYRGWHQLGEEPLFWFGAGLGYGTWAYHRARLGADGGSLEVEVENVGERPSREVVQVYLRPEDDVVRLIGWGAATIEPGARATVQVPFDARAMRRWDEAARAWGPVLGGRLLVARGLGDIRLELDLAR